MQQSGCEHRCKQGCCPAPVSCSLFLPSQGATNQGFPFALLGVLQATLGVLANHIISRCAARKAENREGESKTLTARSFLLAASVALF